ncbi:hypothetical protein MMC18_005440 [Xylographa bjoerkii]|nr:hypothetical protein [Xylographa bjoerkii]
MAAIKPIIQIHSVEVPSAAVVTPALTPAQPELDPSPLPDQHTTSLPIPTSAISSASSRHHPTRQAASGAHYNLSATWSSFTEYLTESGSSGSEEGPEKYTNSVRKRRTRGSDVLSEDDSDSDEYLNNGDGGKKVVRRRIGTKGVDDREKQRRRKRRIGRLGRADLEVIHGQNPASRGVRGKKTGKPHEEKLNGLTRKEAGRLVEYLLGTTDWVGAANHVRGGALVKSEAVKMEPMEEQLRKPSDLIAQATQRSIGPDHLKTHWKETLSKRLVDLYID